MPKVIEIPEIGNVEFPDSMTDDQISKAISDTYAPNAGLSGPAQPKNPILERIGQEDAFKRQGGKESASDLGATLGILTGATGGPAGAAMSGLAGATATPESGPGMNGAGIASALASKIPGGGVGMGVFKGLLSLLGAKAGQQVAGQESGNKLQLSDLAYPTVGGAAGSLEKYAKTNKVVQSQNIMDRLREKVFGVAGNAAAAKDLPGEVNAGARTAIVDANTQLTAAEAAAKQSQLTPLGKVGGNLKDQAAVKARLVAAEEVAKNEVETLKSQLKNPPSGFTSTAREALEQKIATAQDKLQKIKLGQAKVEVRSADTRGIEQELKQQQRLDKVAGVPVPKGIDAIPNGRKIMNELGTAKAEDFNELVYNGGAEYMKVAKALLGKEPGKMKQLKDGFVNHVMQDTYNATSGQFSGEALGKRLLTEKGQGALKELYPDAEDITHLVSQFKDFSVAANAPSKLGGVKSLATTAGAAIVGWKMHIPELMEAAAVAGGAQAYSKFSWGTFMDKWMTDDTFRQGALEWAKNGQIENAGKAAANAFYGFLQNHTVKK